MDHTLAIALRDSRNSYRYPVARIEETTRLGSAEKPFRSAGMPFRFSEGDPATRTSISLDRSFTDLLRSSTARDQLRGVASVVYWGYQTFSRGYARRKVEWLIKPQRGHGADLCSPAAIASIRKAIEAVDAGQVGDALHAIGRISQLSRTPFASKVIAFMRPASVGVYDNQIRRLLERPDQPPDSPIGLWLQTLVKENEIARGVGPVSEPRVRKRFENWCRALREAAENLNALGETLRWRDVHEGPQPWRAIDVERAIFALTQRE